MEAMEELVSYVLAVVDLTLENVAATTGADMHYPSLRLLKDFQSVVL